MKKATVFSQVGTNSASWFT